MTHTYELAGKTVKDLAPDINAGVLTQPTHALVLIKLEATCATAQDDAGLAWPSSWPQARSTLASRSRTATHQAGTQAQAKAKALPSRRLSEGKGEA